MKAKWEPSVPKKNTEGDILFPHSEECCQKIRDSFEVAPDGLNRVTTAPSALYPV